MAKKKVVIESKEALVEVVQETDVEAVIETLEETDTDNVLVEDVLNGTPIIVEEGTQTAKELEEVKWEPKEVVNDTEEVIELEKKVGQDEEKANDEDSVQESNENGSELGSTSTNLEDSGANNIIEVVKVKKDSLVIYCEACNDLHVIDKKGIRWFNGSRTKPTVKPQITFETELETCQFFITNGEFRYSDKCTHEYAGKRIKMLEI